MNLLSDARSLSRKVKKSSFDAQIKTSVARIQKLILKHAAMGEGSIRIRNVPYRRELVAADEDSFMAIAKTFAKLGFTVSYDTSGKDEERQTFILTSRKKVPPPESYWTRLNISWGDE